MVVLLFGNCTNLVCGLQGLGKVLKAIRKRSVWVEPLFGEAKEFHRLRRFCLRRLLKVNIEGVMIAAGQNLKRLIKHNLSKLLNFPNTAIHRMNFRPPAT
jgi:hypothetical protein